MPVHISKFILHLYGHTPLQPPGLSLYYAFNIPIWASIRTVRILTLHGHCSILTTGLVFLHIQYIPNNIPSLSHCTLSFFPPSSSMSPPRSVCSCFCLKLTSPPPKNLFAARFCALSQRNFWLPEKEEREREGGRSKCAFPTNRGGEREEDLLLLSDTTESLHANTGTTNKPHTTLFSFLLTRGRERKVLELGFQKGFISDCEALVCLFFSCGLNSVSRLYYLKIRYWIWIELNRIFRWSMHQDLGMCEPLSYSNAIFYPSTHTHIHSVSPLTLSGEFIKGERKREREGKGREKREGWSNNPTRQSLLLHFSYGLSSLSLPFLFL